MHTTNVSEEPLEIIFANECNDDSSLATKRFRRLQNEIEFRDKLIGELRSNAGYIQEAADHLYEENIRYL
jgi:hypothetical protein